MSILKMRDENGTIHSIAIMKGDKGDGVPDGGTTGQVIKKTADGTEWGDTGVPDNGIAGQVLKKTESGTAWGDVNIAAKCEALLMNTDVTINSYTIEKRGLYEVVADFSPYNSGVSGRNVFVMSISDLNKMVDEIRLFNAVLDSNNNLRISKMSCYYRNGEISVSSTETTSTGATVSGEAYLLEVRLIIPYD